MASPKVFIDTSGFFAALVLDDPNHRQAIDCFGKWRKSGTYLVASDYVADETATLLKARGAGQLLERFFELCAGSEAFSLQFITEGRFYKARDFFLRHRDHRYSFTDCTSFLLMKELGITEALTTDSHFEEAGFIRLLA